MSIETVPGTELRYHLLAYDKEGHERPDGDGVFGSAEAVRELNSGAVTDVFIVSHGWKGDVPAAREQHNSWFRAMLECTEDLTRVRHEYPGFHPVIIGFHWPSQPWGDEDLDGSGLAFDPGSISPSRRAIDEFAETISDTPSVREALGVIFEHAAHHSAPATLPSEIAEAYAVLNRESGLSADGEGAAPGADREPFDPDRVFEFAAEDNATTFGATGRGEILAPLRSLSFWTMKARARRVGETGGAELLQKLQAAASGSTRFHLMGHSFGSIVMAGMLRNSSADRPVHSLFLVQGALSLWSFCSDIPYRQGTSGYFRGIIDRGAVEGPIVTTRSIYDTAVARLYPLGAGVARQVTFAPATLPQYGGLGTFGIQGPGLELVDEPMREHHVPYSFSPGRVYNLEASNYIRVGGGFAGAHNDITHPAVAHAFWEAAFPRPSVYEAPAGRHDNGAPATSPQPLGTTPVMFPSLIYVNGIDALTGNYLVPPLDVRDAVDIVRDPAVPDPARDQVLSRWLARAYETVSQPSYGLPWDVDAARPEQAGWGIVFHVDEDEEVRSALRHLIEHRRTQVGANVRELDYRTGEDVPEWLARHGTSIGSVDPAYVPYYLLLVGSPSRIPFTFGHQLDVEYAVGRLHFETPEEYGRYSGSVVAYETNPSVANSREVVYFATRHDLDAATQLSADDLVAPLADGEPGSADAPVTPTAAQRAGFATRKLLGENATKAALRDVLVSAEGRTPAILFTATHGIGWPAGHENQLALQGALLCQDWPGFGTMAPDYYFAAADLPEEARVHGLITFHFACYGGGTPSQDRFFHKRGQAPPEIANAPFLAALPRALLSHPGGGALACIAHVERAWGYSIKPPRVGPQLLPFRNALGRLMAGQPIGHAMKDFNERYAALGSLLGFMLVELDYGKQIAHHDLISTWIQRNDAEGYVVIGDPAVSLRIAELS